MPRKKVRLREVAGLLATLEESGARDVYRAAPNPRGLVEVRWRLSPAEEAKAATVERAERTAILLSAAFAVVVIAVLLAAVL